MSKRDKGKKVNDFHSFLKDKRLEFNSCVFLLYSVKCSLMTFILLVTIILLLLIIQKRNFKDVLLSLFILLLSFIPSIVKFFEIQIEIPFNRFNFKINHETIKHYLTQIQGFSHYVLTFIIFATCFCFSLYFSPLVFLESPKENKKETKFEKHFLNLKNNIFQFKAPNAKMTA